MGKGVLDLEKHFAQYGAYHNNQANIVIHTIFVWPILFTGLLLFHFTPPSLHLPPVIADVLPFTLRDVLCLNFGFFFALVYALYYVAFDDVAGSLGAALVAACWVGSSLVGNSLGFSLAWKVVGISQLVWTVHRSWIIRETSSCTSRQPCSSLFDGSILCSFRGSS